MFGGDPNFQAPVINEQVSTADDIMAASHATELNLGGDGEQTELQKLRLKKQDLERALEEQGDRVAMTLERMKKAETYAAECQLELGKVRVENSELDKLNVRARVLRPSAC